MSLGRIVSLQVDAKRIPDIVQSFLEHAFIDVVAWNHGHYQRLELDTARYEGYLSPYKIEIFASKDNTRSKQLIWKETFFGGLPESLKELVKDRERCRHFLVEFIDVLDRRKIFAEYKKWKACWDRQQTTKVPDSLKLVERLRQEMR